MIDFGKRIKCKETLVFLLCNSQFVSNEVHPALQQASSSSPTHCIKFSQNSRSTQLHKHNRHQVCVCMYETPYAVNSFKGTSDSIAICNCIKFSIKNHTSSYVKLILQCPSSISFFLAEFTLHFLQVSI
jgi:hypothetical protein